MTSAALSLPALRLKMPEMRHWLSGLMLATAAGLYLLAGLSLATVDSGPGFRSDEGSSALADLRSPPKPEPLRFKPVAPQDAVAINAAVPVSNLANPSANAFLAAFGSDGDRLRALECLTAAVYYEAAIEPLEGQRAVAQVVLNRSRHPA